MEEHTLNLILAISSILTAIGTLSAVILSLYLSTRNRNIDLDVSVNISRQILMADPPIPDDNKYLSFSITNVGFRDANITSVRWEMGLFDKKHFSQIFDFSHPYITKLPAKLKDGDQANLFIKVSEMRNNEDFLQEIYNGPFSRIWFLFFKLNAVTSTGEEFSCKMNKRVRKMFLRLKREENLV